MTAKRASGLSRSHRNSLPMDGVETPPLIDVATNMRGRSVSQELRPGEWKVVNGRLLHKARSVPHERSVSARFDTEAHGILPRFANEPRSPTVRRLSLIHI